MVRGDFTNGSQWFRIFEICAAAPVGLRGGEVTLKARIHIMLHVILGILIMVIAFFSF